MIPTIGYMICIYGIARLTQEATRQAGEISSTVQTRTVWFAVSIGVAAIGVIVLGLLGVLLTGSQIDVAR